MGYLGQAPGLGVKREFLFIAAASQTTFSGTDSNGLTLFFDPRNVVVFVNGVRVIKDTDYSVPDVSTIIFTTGLAENDEVSIESFESFSPANTYTKDEADDLFPSTGADSGFSETQKGQLRANIGTDVLGGFRNKIGNGDFEINQRGGVGATAIGYTLDRWRQAWNGSGTTRAVSQQSFSKGQTDVPGNPRYFARVANTGSAPTGQSLNQFEQRCEGADILAGKKATVTAYLKASASLTLPNITVSQNFGSGGSASVLTEAGTNLALTTEWQKFTFVVDVPSVVGKTFGPGDFTGVTFNLPLNSLFQIDIAHVSLVEGDATAEADPFSPRHIEQELALCQRYYQVHALNDIGAVDYRYASGAGTPYAHVGSALPVTMRATPSNAIVGTPVYTNCSGMSVRSTPTGFSASVSATAVGLYRAHSVSVTLDAEL